MSVNIGRVIIIVVISLAILPGAAFIFIRPYWLRFHRLGRRFNYRITDIWASMLGIAPSMTAATLFMNECQRPNFNWERAWGAPLAILALALFQIVGLAVGRIDIELPPHAGAQNGFESGVSIVTGALIGLIVYCVSFTILMIVLGIFGIL